MPTRHDLKPPARIGEKLIQVGPPSWSGYKAVLAACDRCKIHDSIAAFDLSHLKTALPDIQQEALATNNLSIANLVGAVAGVVTDNLPTLVELALKHPPVVEAVLLAGSNLTAAEIEELDPGTAMRTFNAAANELAATGVFTEMLNFFIARLGGQPSAPNTSGQQSTSDTPSSAAA